MNAVSSRSSVTALSQNLAIQKLQAVDTKVHAHENAHISGGAGVVSGGASFTYVRGPDGRGYAVEGEVPIDTSEESSSDKTIEKMGRVRAAALAPSDPSPQDLRVASTATMLEMRARITAQQEKSPQSSPLNSYSTLNT